MCSPSFVIFGEISPFEVMFLPLESGLRGLITNLGSTIWALVSRAMRAWVNSSNFFSLVRRMASSRMVR